jgi:hypothetical protein
VVRLSINSTRARCLTITHIFCRHTLLQTNSQRESPSHLWEGRSLSSGEGLGTSLDEAMARRHLGMACHSGGRLPSALAVTLRISSISSRRRLRARITGCVSSACWLALVRFRLQYLGWRTTSLGLGELTLRYCGNAFGVKKGDFVAQMETLDSRTAVGSPSAKDVGNGQPSWPWSPRIHTAVYPSTP